MDGIGLLHLLFFFPFGDGIVVENYVAIVARGGGIFHPEIARGDLVVGEFWVLLDGSGVAPGTTEGEDSGGRAEVALSFNTGTSGIGVDAAAPDEAFFTEATFPRCGDGGPFPGLFFIEREADVRAIPMVSDADQALAGAGRELESRKWQGGEQGE